MIESNAPRPIPHGRVLLAALATSAALVAAYLLSAGAPGALTAATAPPAAADDYGQLPIAFEPNAGRYPESVDFVAGASSGGLMAGEEGLRFTQAYGSSEHPRAAAIELSFTGGELDRPTAAERLPGVVNDLRGPSHDHVAGIPTYAHVGYEQVWPGVALDVYGRAGRPEYDFRLAPGADPSRIRMRVAGADRLHLTPAGDLLIDSGGARFHQAAPVAFQPGPNGRAPVPARFVLDGRSVSFDLGAYDSDRPLVIDPLTIAYSTYLGGNASDFSGGMAVDSSGAAYLTGATDSTDFDTVGPIDGNDPATDAFVSKINAAGSALVYSTYLGGNGQDRGAALALDGSGAAYVAGFTGSTDFPTTPGAFQTSLSGFIPDGFVAKLNPTGSALVYSTFIGGSTGLDNPQAVAVDSSGAAYIGGFSDSTDFPTTVGAFQPAPAGSGDAYVTKFNPSGSALVYSTFLGGAASEQVTGLAVDAAGAAYVMGGTNSTDFPTASPIQAANAGDYDTFLSKLNPAGSSLAYSTYIGGSALDNAGNLAIDSDGAAYVGGFTRSTDYPTVNAMQSDAGDADGVLTKVNPAGTAYVYSTYIGGGDFDWTTGQAVDSAGSVWVTGYTASADFPTLNPVSGKDPALDGFLLNVKPDGSGIRTSTLIGGAGDDLPGSVALAAGGVYIAGYTTSTDYPVVGGIEGDSTADDLFLTRFNLDTAGPQTQIDSGPPDGSTISDKMPSFDFSADEDGSTFECSLQPQGEPPGAFGPCSGPGATHTPASDLADGGYVFAVRAIDPFGNVDASPATTLFTVASPAVMPTCLGLTATVVTTAGDDDVGGTPGDDVIVGRGGSDKIRGFGGNDLLCGRSGDDRIYGGGGDDRLRGGVQAGKDHDVIRGGGGADRIFGFAGDEKLAGGAGPDHINGGGGADRLRGQAGGDDLLGGPGGDSLNGGTQSDRCVGGPGRDRSSNCERKGLIGQSH